jgi:hypothetical protein
MWYYQTADTLYEYVNDGTSSFWLDISGMPNTFANVSITNNLAVSGAGSVTGNLTVGNLITNNGIYYANGTAFSGGATTAKSYYWGQIF